MDNPFLRSMFLKMPVPEKYALVAQSGLDLRRRARKLFPGMSDKMELTHAEIPFLLDTVNPLSSNMTNEDANQFAELLHFTTRWAASGFPHFKLTSDLTSALMLTDCSGVSAGEIKWPFTSFLLSLPEDSPVVFKDIEGEQIVVGRHIAAHSMLVPDDKSDRTYGGAYEVALDKAKREVDLTGQPKNYWRYYQKHLAHVKYTMATVIRIFDNNDTFSIFHANRWPAADQTIVGWIKCQGPDRTPFLDTVDRYGMMAGARLVVNFILYLTEQQRSGLWNPKRAINVMSRTSKGFVTQPTTWLMGQEIKLPGSLHDAAKAYSSQGFTDGAKREFKVRAQQVVMGHWRRQSIKEKSLLESPRHHPLDGRPQRWIQPYERNKDQQLGFLKTYSVDLKKK